MARCCAFCGGTPLTKEHGWPRWLESYLPGLRLNQTVIGDDYIPQTRGVRSSISGGEVREICETCNSGWMSELENAAKPLVGPMAQGDSTFLSRPHQEIVAAWIVKTCFIHTLVNPESKREWLAPDYHDFYRAQRPLGRHFVCVGVFDEPGFGGTYSKYQPIIAVAEKNGPPSVEDRNAYLMTLAVGRFMGQVFMMPHPVRQLYPSGRHIVWPYVKDLVWPLLFTYDLLGLERVARTDFPTIDPHPRSSALNLRDVLRTLYPKP